VLAKVAVLTVMTRFVVVAAEDDDDNDNAKSYSRTHTWI
jgi:hypothetical protein